MSEGGSRAERKETEKGVNLRRQRLEQLDNRVFQHKNPARFCSDRLGAAGTNASL